MNLSIIIVNWNTREHLQKCLRSIDEHLAGIPLEIIVADNGSTDGSVEMLQTGFPGVCLIRNETNLGFAAACDAAAAKARGEFLLLLNPDIVIGAGIIQEMLAFIEANPEAAAAPLLELPDGRLQLGPGGRLPTRATAFNHFFLLSRLCQRAFPGIWLYPYDFKSPIRVDWLSGACFLLRRRHFESAGGFDENFFMYAEDIDLCRRLSDKGIKFHLLPLRALHDHGAAFRKAGSPDYAMDALFNYLVKHGGADSARIVMNYARLGLALRAMILRAAGFLLRSNGMLQRAKMHSRHAARARKIATKRG